MSCSIVFETKIAILSDGRLIHFDRSGCNNDNSGRRKDDWTARILTAHELIKKLNDYQRGKKPFKDCGEFELKVCGKPATMYDYAKHLERMWQRALPYDEFIKKYQFQVEHLTAVELIQPENKMMTVEEFHKEFYDILYTSGPTQWYNHYEYPDIRDEAKIVDLIEKGEALRITLKSWKSRR